MQVHRNVLLLLAASAVFSPSVAADEPPPRQAPATAEVELDPGLKEGFLRAVDVAVKAPGSWTAEFEEVSTSVKGAQSTTSTVTGEVTSSSEGYLIRLLRRNDAPIDHAFVVTARRTRERIAEGIRIGRSVDTLWALPLLAPSEPSLRAVGLPPANRWTRLLCDTSVEGVSIWQLDNTPNEQGAVSQFRLRFEKVRGRLESFEWWVRPGVVSEPKPVELTITVDAWTVMGESVVPSKITRKAVQRSRDGTPDLHAEQILRLRNITSLDAEQARVQVSLATRPYAGDIVEDSADGIRIQSGGSWVEIRGERFELSEPVFDLPLPDLPALLERAAERNRGATSTAPKAEP